MAYVWRLLLYYHFILFMYNIDIGFAQQNIIQCVLLALGKTFIFSPALKPKMIIGTDYEFTYASGYIKKIST